MNHCNLLLTVMEAVTESAVKTRVGSSGCPEQNIINIGIHDDTFDEAHKSCS